MIKIYIYTVLFLCLFTLESFIIQNPSTNPDIIYWHEQKLTWDDFQGIVPKESKYTAVCHSSFVLNWKHLDDSLKCEITTEFNKSKSWKKTKYADDYGLNHEQCHFDLTEYISRCLRKQVAEYRFNSVETFFVEKDSIMDVYNKKYHYWQDLYDKETNHSINKEAQSKWDKKIDSLLHSMEAYSEPKVNVYIGYLFE